MLETLTVEQESFMAVVTDEYLSLLSEPPPEIDPKAIRDWLTVVYGFYDKPLPERIEVAPSPEAALLLATELTGERQTTMDWMGLSDAGWVSFYDYWRRAGVLNEEESADVMKLAAFMLHVFDTVLLDECAIVVARPLAIRVDDDGNLHSATGPCIEWKDGEKDYAWHGVWVDERIILSPRSYTKEEYQAITQVEVRRALAEAAGWDHIVTLLGAKELGSWTDERTGLSYHLLGSDTERWLRKQSPRLQNESQPFYVEPVHEELQTAQAARKWQATDWTPAQCERDPALEYGIET